MNVEYGIDIDGEGYFKTVELPFCPPLGLRMFLEIYDDCSGDFLDLVVSSLTWHEDKQQLTCDLVPLSGEFGDSEIFQIKDKSSGWETI